MINDESNALEPRRRSGSCKFKFTSEYPNIKFEQADSSGQINFKEVSNNPDLKTIEHVVFKYSTNQYFRTKIDLFLRKMQHVETGSQKYEQSSTTATSK